jgi:hypothetical protein
LYTILLGNPQLKKPQSAPSETRFKLWWQLVGSAVENAAKLVDDKLAPKFKDLFLANEEEDSESMSLGEALKLMADKWRDGDKEIEFTADTVTEFIKLTEGAALREFLCPDPDRSLNRLVVSRLLAGHVGNPVKVNDRELTLRSRKDSHTKCKVFWVRTVFDDAAAEAADKAARIKADAVRADAAKRAAEVAEVEEGADAETRF